MREREEGRETEGDSERQKTETQTDTERRSELGSRNSLEQEPISGSHRLPLGQGSWGSREGAGH